MDKKAKAICHMISKIGTHCFGCTKLEESHGHSYLRTYETNSLGKCVNCYKPRYKGLK